MPLALTHKIHPAALRPAPLEPRFFIRRVPQSLTTVLVSGLVVGSFYGLAPLYANQLGLPNEQVGLYMGACIFAGLLVQWPLGWLSDRRDRAWLIRACAILLCLFALPLALLQQMPWRCCWPWESPRACCSSPSIRWQWPFPTTMWRPSDGFR